MVVFIQIFKTWSAIRIRKMIISDLMVCVMSVLLNKNAPGKIILMNHPRSIFNYSSTYF